MYKRFNVHCFALTDLLPNTEKVSKPLEYSVSESFIRLTNGGHAGLIYE